MQPDQASQSFTKLIGLLTFLQTNASTIGVTIAGLLVIVYAIAIMLNNDPSPAARATRWEQLQRVFICAVIIVGFGFFVQLASGLGKML